jgi:hypothetical protein
VLVTIGLGRYHGSMTGAGLLALSFILAGGGDSQASSRASGTAGERRVAPLGDANPTVVTRTLLRRLATGQWPLNRFIDPKRGLIAVTYTTSECGPADGCDEKGVTRRSSHACGSELPVAVQALQKEIADRVQGADEVRCSNRSRHSCELAVAGEFASTIELLFVETPRGLMLEAVLTRNSANRDLSNESRYTANRLRIERQRACA